MMKEEKDMKRIAFSKFSKFSKKRCELAVEEASRILQNTTMLRYQKVEKMWYLRIGISHAISQI